MQVPAFSVDDRSWLPDGPWNGPRRRVVVAMSGGVDSSLVAALLAAAGHDVVGVTLQLYDDGAARGRAGACCAGQDIHDARRVAAALGIPHYVLDYEQHFARRVIDSFAASYAAGETPIPCVTCNQQIKFGDLLLTAAELGAEVMATGHYVERRETPAGPTLHAAADAARDQSWFLFATTLAQLERLWFPLGSLPKSEVRALARRLALPVADKKDSQDICFVPSGRYADVVARLRPDAAEPGDIVHVDGRVLGRHSGIMGFTVGQRRGIGVAGGEPLFVVRIDAPRRRVVVGPRAALATRVIELREVNWLGEDALRPGVQLPVAARVRSSQPLRPARLEIGKVVRIVLAEPEPGIAPGQACVLYADLSPRARVLGGGFISRAVAQPAVEAVGADLCSVAAGQS
jgi:tRNA-specific 2-thiouridylase